MCSTCACARGLGTGRSGDDRGSHGQAGHTASERSPWDHLGGTPVCVGARQRSRGWRISHGGRPESPADRSECRWILEDGANVPSVNFGPNRTLADHSRCCGRRTFCRHSPRARKMRPLELRLCATKLPCEKSQWMSGSGSKMKRNLSRFFYDQKACL